MSAGGLRWQPSAQIKHCQALPTRLSVGGKYLSRGVNDYNDFFFLRRWLCFVKSNKMCLS